MGEKGPRAIHAKVTEDSTGASIRRVRVQVFVQPVDALSISDFFSLVQVSTGPTIPDPVETVCIPSVSGSNSTSRNVMLACTSKYLFKLKTLVFKLTRLNS